MHARAQPSRDIGGTQPLGQLGLVHQGAVGQVPGDTRRAVAQQLLAQDAAHAVGGDQGIAFDQLAGLGSHGDHAVRFGKAFNGLAQVQVHARISLSGFLQQLLQIGPVDGGVGSAVAMHGLAAQRHVPQFLPCGGAAHPQAVRQRHHLLQRLCRPQACRRRTTFGPSWIPAPTSLSTRACSKRRTSQPARDAPIAAARPPMPPPAINTCLFMRVLCPCLRPWWLVPGYSSRPPLKKIKNHRICLKHACIRHALRRRDPETPTSHAPNCRKVHHWHRAFCVTARNRPWHRRRAMSVHRPTFCTAHDSHSQPNQFLTNGRANEKSPHKAGSFNMRDGKIR